MSVMDWVGLSGAVATLITALAAGIRFMIKSYLKELKPNGGSSMRDELNRQSASIKRLEERIDSIYELLLEKK